MIPGIPSYLQQNTAAAPQSYMAQLPGLFNTSGLTSSYNNQISTNFDQGRALAAAAANQYTTRAQQEGGSTLGAGFAQAGAMLPVYAQNAALQSDLANKQLQYRGQQATIGAGLAGDIGKLQSQQQSTYSDYLMNQQRLNQQQQQYLGQFSQNEQQFRQTAAEKAREFNLQLSALRGGGAGGTGGASAQSMYGFTGALTRTPNNAGTGGVQYTPQFAQYLNATGNQGLLAQGAPQYPQQSGVGSGSYLDAYQAQQRQLGNAASPWIPAYNQQVLNGNPYAGAYA